MELETEEGGPGEWGRRGLSDKARRTPGILPANSQDSWRRDADFTAIWHCAARGNRGHAIDSTGLRADPSRAGPGPANQPAPAVTTLLRAWAQGDEAAGEQLFPILYGELRRQAGRYMRRERRSHTLQPSGLVNEAYLRLAGSPDLDWHSRAQFFAIAARVMRQVLVDHADAGEGRQARGLPRDA